MLGCQRSKPISHLDKESLREKSAWHLIVIPWSMAENSSIIIIQTDFDEPACAHSVQCDLCSKMRPLLWEWLRQSAVFGLITFGKVKSLLIGADSSKNNSSLDGFSCFSATDRSCHKKNPKLIDLTQKCNQCLPLLLAAPQWKEIATESCKWATSWILGAQRITSFSSMSSRSDRQRSESSLVCFWPYFLPLLITSVGL